MSEHAFSYKWLLFSFDGRINRAKYWAYMGPVYGLVCGFTVWMLSVGTDAGSIKGALFLLGLVIAYPSLAVQTKRLHDFNYSGWWNLLSFIGVLNIGVFLACGIHKGTKGPNRYGPNPLEPPTAESVPTEARAAGVEGGEVARSNG